jgi:putative FmdB family regulatory protein
MPTYDYRCDSCGIEWTVEQSVKEEPVRICPSCGAEKATRLISGRVGFSLLGSGWAKDNYRG